MARRDVLRRREYSKDFNDRHGRVGAFQRKLRRLVAAEAERHVRKSHVRYLVPDVALRGGVL
jgi:hypothetical protein